MRERVKNFTHVSRFQFMKTVCNKHLPREILHSQMYFLSYKDS